MNQNHIDTLLNEPIPEADSNARKIAINSAVSQFSHEVNQGNIASDRPIDTLGGAPRDQSSWSAIMNFLNRPSHGRVFATIVLGFVSFALVKQLPSGLPETTPTTSIISELDASSLQADNVELRDSLISASPAPAPEKLAKTLPPSTQTSITIATPLEMPLEMPQQRQAMPLEEVVVSRAHTQQLKSQVENQVETQVEFKSETKVEMRDRPDLKESLSQNRSQQIMQADGELIIMATKARAKTAKIRRELSDIEASTVTAEGLVQVQSNREPNDSSSYPPTAPTLAESSSNLSSPLLALPKQRPDRFEQYPSHQESVLKLVRNEPVSTFSADVDTASYSLIRNQLQRGFLPAPTAVRTEEVINYFSYNYVSPDSKELPFRASISVVNSPWNKSKKLIHIGIKGYDFAPTEIPDSNLVFLLDVSASMRAPNKLPLIKKSIALLIKTLKPSDKISIVAYSGAAGVVLEPTQASDDTKILAALESLDAGGSTAGGVGIELAYQLAEKNFNSDATNRIILATDGDFNVGQQSNQALKTLVERKRENGVLLSVLGFGRNNYQDDMMQALAQNGNGVAAYIDSLSEARKVLVDQANSTLFTIAKNVKFQIEFNPNTVSEYRLVGYETRHLYREDFNNDKVDAGDIGSGHTMTAIYEITPTAANKRSIDPLRYRDEAEATFVAKNSDEYGYLKMRYILPNESESQLIDQPIPNKLITTSNESDLGFSIAAASFAQHLKGGKYIGNMSLADIIEFARANRGEDKNGYRGEFIRLLELAKVAKP